MRRLSIALLSSLTFAPVALPAPARAATVPPTGQRCIVVTQVNQQSGGRYDLNFRDSCSTPVSFFLCVVRSTSGGATAQQLCQSIAYQTVSLAAGQSTVRTPPGTPATWDINECPTGYTAVPTRAHQARTCTN